MSDPKPFHDPHITLSRIYTKTGDQGETGLVGGQRVPKDSPRIDCYGTVDELLAVVGLAAVSAHEHPQLAPLAIILRRVQHELFNLGSNLATLPQDVHPNQPRITPFDVQQLENEMDEINAGLGVLHSFVLPGGCRINAELHLARTVCRRAERLVVALSRREAVSPEVVMYLNRLSDAFFVWSRWASQTLGVPEVLWDPNKSTSAL